MGKRWRVIRWVREEYVVEAESRKEALERAEDPLKVEVTEESCRRLFD